ncbi:MAG: MgtC/SapB family protein [Candidatus Eremiobacteraeota bacterium]|nr:MgtC/SapB family protein [Candidatus Eremiobacteraeota bacterium]
MLQPTLGLILAALLGAVVGFQRQYTHKPAGIRTHALVSVGSCAFATYSTLLNDTRIAAAVVTGIGFLGAGAIVRQGFTTRGLTTAASIWTASAIGMGVGLGDPAWLVAVVALTLLSIALLTIPDDAIIRLLPPRTAIAIVVDADLDRISLEDVRAELVRCADHVRFRDELKIERDGTSRRASIGFIVRLDVKHGLTGIFETMSLVDGVLRIAVADEPVAPTS